MKTNLRMKTLKTILILMVMTLFFVSCSSSKPACSKKRCGAELVD